MGATVAEGKCGPRPSDNRTYCICDYGMTRKKIDYLLAILFILTINKAVFDQNLLLH